MRKRNGAGAAAARLVLQTGMLTEQIVATSHDPERKRRQRAGVGPREELIDVN
jgi:hypothetical protein